jgi:predicted amidohydrolase
LRAAISYPSGWTCSPDARSNAGDENGVYAVFSNPIGWDYDTVKPGLAMILDPFGEVLVESNAVGDDVVVGTLTPEKISQSSGNRYLKARRPELYGKLVEPQESVTLPGWQMEHEVDPPGPETAGQNG